VVAAFLNPIQNHLDAASVHRRANSHCVPRRTSLAQMTKKKEPIVSDDETKAQQNSPADAPFEDAWNMGSSKRPLRTDQSKQEGLGTPLSKRKRNAKR